MVKQKKVRRKRKLEDDIDPERKVKKELKLDDEDEKIEVDSMAEETAGIHTILPTRELFAEQLLILLKSDNLVIIDGDVGCGKSFLSRHAATLLLLPLRVMQMGDQLDSKCLLGSYECTEVAGNFKWKKSNFFEWLSSPGVILIEDIDTGNADVINSLVNMAISRKMILPTGEAFNLHPQCSLIGTTQSTRLGVQRKGILEGVHSRLSLPSLSDDELKRLGKTIFPRIGHIVNAICRIFRELESLPGSGNSRKLTSSDVMRAFNRVNTVENLSSSQAILLELLDVWCICEPSKERRELMSSMMGTLLSLTKDEVDSSLTHRIPSLAVTESSFSIGRVSLERLSILSMERSIRLGHTKGALQLLERMGLSVKMEEAVLLVGESGVGKTSLVQVLADMRGQKLCTVNLGPHTDTDDLITSLRPTSYGRLMESFTRDFITTFSRSFDPAKNHKFMNNLEMYLLHQKYDEYLKVVEETAKRILSKKREPEWAALIVRGRRLREGLEKGATPFAVQRGIVREAAEEGYWLLIDEINLAPPECLDAIVDAISTSHHPSFRLFACMNPATDTAKRRLPPGIRSRFIEYYVAEDCDATDLAKIVSSYLPSSSVQSIQSIIKLYMEAKKLYPHKISLRSLTRALIFCGDGRFDNENRCLYEAFAMAFLSNMEKEDKESMHKMITKMFPCEKKGMMKREKEDSIMIEGYEIERGDAVPVEDKGYVMTPTVIENLKEVARIVSSKRLAVLLEGETSAGKTSIVSHLAKITGNIIRRINNHEQTDVQEYLGSYVPDEKGRLYFREGPLVEAVKKGYWVILDELNLAPSDVIETLNRLLDDNRELFISESNQVIKAHPRFRLFATQNPAGSYAGRKRLSRALLSRFVVLLFPILPLNELSQMVCARCEIAPSAADRMIKVLSELRLQRSLSGLFSSKDGLMTLRDVFRWGFRLASDKGDDWMAAMIHHGFFLLAGRCRNESDKMAVIATLERILKGNIDEKALFSSDSPYFPSHLCFDNVILTYNMRRMLVLSWQGLLRNEAILVVGETGDGKTRLVETIGGKQLITINCHERTESSDLLGRLRPASNGGFEWQDGVVISGMREGKVLLMDEISLAEDSVLERLNPLFEEKRSILLTDAGAETEEVIAVDSFKVMATMNPGGDYGKKELSKALRNRFTEIWSSSSFDREELSSIFGMRVKGIEEREVKKTATILIEWINRYYHKFIHAIRVAPSVRDIVASSDMWSALCERGMDEERALIETVSSVFIDGMPCQMTRSLSNINAIQREALEMLTSSLSHSSPSTSSHHDLLSSPSSISMGDLSLTLGPLPPSIPHGFSLSAPTCMENMYRVMRALYINKPILLEGSPGCGKSTLIMALASLAGYPITRLNLSEQTDLSDLFGSDVPIVDEEGKMSFEWKDGPILKAIKNGEWILLDEMNLASQSILEGLNACFDHRRVLYIAELAREFEIPSTSSCRFFACQNPRGEGGNRRALPKSFVNRFTNIYTDDLKDEDELAILREMKYGMEEDVIKRMVKVNGVLSKELWTGGPFSFNLRDINRWMHMISKTKDIGYSFETLYVNRLRTEKDRGRAREIFKEIMEMESHSSPGLISIDEKTARIGPLIMERKSSSIPSSLHPISSQSSTLLTVMNCLSNGWISLLVGVRNGGKRSVAEMATALLGMEMQVISLSSDTDASELIGSFEQKVDEESIVEVVDSLSGLLSPYSDDTGRLKGLKELEKIESEVELMFTNGGIPDEVRDEVKRILVVSQRSEMYFEWIDSSFVRAYIEGKCILIENVNQCSSAVLDRLNSALESGGNLVLSESRGDYLPIYPHKDFRVILSMDSSEGEISRAMRNRSVEIFMGEEEVWNEKERDVHTILTSLSSNKTISHEFSSALTGLPSRSILFSGLILSQYEEESVAKLMNRTIDVMMSDERIEERRVVPRLNELMDGDKMSEWMMSVWMEEKREEDGYSIPLLPLLASSINMMRGKEWMEVMGERGMRMMEGIGHLLPSTSSNHPIDPTFHGDHTRQPLHSLISSILFQWLSIVSSERRREELSAIDIAATKSIYEMTSSPFYFNKMESSEKFMDEVMRWMKMSVESSEVNSEIVFPLCLSILSLLNSLSQSLSIRTGDTRIRISYSNMVKLIEEVMSGDHPRVEEWNVPPSIEEFILYYNEESIIYPFKERRELEEMIDRVRMMREMSEGMEKDESSFFSLVSTVGRRIEKILSMNGSVDNMVCMNTLDNGWMRVIESLGWKTEEGKRKSVLSSLLSTDLSESIPLSSLLFTSSVSLILSTVWNQLGWDSEMRCITVRNLRDLSFDSFVSQLWRIGANSKVIDDCIRKNLEVVCGESGKKSWEMMIVGMEEMERGLPPQASLDPVIYREEKIDGLEEQMKIVDGMIERLKGWRRRMGGEGYKMDECSTHPFLISLYGWREKLREELIKMKNGQEMKETYREDSKQYSVMCREMHSVYKLCRNVVGLIGEDRWREEKSDMDLFSSHVVSALKSIHSFLQDSLIRFGSLIDVLGGFWNGVWIVYLSLNIIHHEMILHTTRLSLISSSAFPRYLEAPKLSWLGPLRNSVIEWGIRSSSPLSIDLQCALIEWRIGRGEAGLVEMEWTRSQWEKWYEKNTTKENKKEFEYKEKTMEEKEEIEMEEMFSGLSGMEGSVGEENLISLLESFEEKKKREDSPFDGDKKKIVTAIAQLNAICGGIGVKEEWRNAGLDASLYVFSSLDQSKSDVIDVYRETSWNEMKESIEECRELKEKTEALREKWPEVQSLALIIDAIESFMDSSLSIGQMRMAEKLEKIIEETEEWEKLADRAHSVEGVVSPLRERLVKWKKMEILSWNRLVTRVKKDCEDRAALVAFPLFEALMKEDTSEETIVVMACDWISRASLIDFNQRLKTTRCLAQWAEMVNKEEVGRKLRRVVGYYGQFGEKVKKELKGIVDPIERLMKDLVRIAQYKDLNLLSIKASSKKNHVQLFKMARKLKNEGGCEMSKLMDEVMDIDGWKTIGEEKIEMEKREDEEGIVKRARDLSSDIILMIGETMDWNKWSDMGDEIDGVKKECARRIEYSGEEKEMESQQGRERNMRQRGVAMMIKECQGMGVNSRRGMTLNGEEVSRRVLCDIDEKIEKRKNIVRAVGLGRNILIRRGMKPNEQVSTSTRGHLLGMVEYGCDWMIENEKRMDEWKKIEEEMSQMKECLKNEMKNSTQDERDTRLIHSEMKEVFERLDEELRVWNEVMGSLKMRLKTVPATVPQEADSSWSPLSRLHSSSEELSRVEKMVEDIDKLREKMKNQMDEMKKNGECGVYPRSIVENGCEMIREQIEEWMGRMEDNKRWFEEETKIMSGIMHKIKGLLQKLPMTSENEKFSLPIEPLLLFIQRLYKSTVETREEWEVKEIDRVIKSASTLSKARVEEVITLISSGLNRISNGDKMENLHVIYPLLSIVQSLLNGFVSIHGRCSHGIGIVVDRLAELGIHLMEKGYMNTIPKEEKEEGGEGKEMDGEGGGGGMGEGKGAKDVTEEMEETGQIEGLKGDEEEEEEAGDSGKSEKNEKPIEMEDDFAKDLEDVDKDGDESGDDDGENENDEIEMDDGMGEVDEKDEEEIDPHLWDEDEKEDKKDDDRMDEDNKGADEETGDMAAREDKNAEKREEDEEKEEGEEDDDEKKNEDGDGEDDVENMDKNERENKEELEEVEGEKKEKEDSEEMKGEEEENMEIGEDAVDENDEEDEEEKDGDEEENENGDGEEIDEKNDEDEAENDNVQMKEDIENGEEKKEEEDEKKKMDSGYGGDKNEEEEEDGGGAEREEEEEKENDEKGEGGRDEKEEKKDGKKKEDGGDEKKKKEEKKNEEGEDEDGQKEDKEKKREIVVEDEKEVEEETETVEGNEDENGEERQENRGKMENDRMMSGRGTLEEARESMRRKEEKSLEKKENIDKMGGEMEMEENGEEKEKNEGFINFNVMDMMSVTEKLTKELVIGEKKESEEMGMMMEMEEKTEEHMEKCRLEWERISPVVSLLAAELAENLRLILEPRLATRMEGDYRSGKRLNMKRIIPYIASQYRKDRIWMRRTKKAERNYEVLIAVDDSASMAENGMETLTCEGVCIVEEALRRVNCGQLSVITFGETIKEIIPFTHASTTQSTGETMLSALSFNQSSTDMVGMLSRASKMMEEIASAKSEQMLIIISDGRGALANGVEKIRHELSRLSRVSILFVILDCGKKSIKEMKVASFVNDQVELIPYLSLFPFPLYVLAQSATSIPSLLAEGIRQWIEYGSHQ